MALPVNGSTHLIHAAYYSFIDPERMKGWVGLVGWPLTDGLPTLVVTHQLQVERRTGKVRQSQTDVLPLCHATNIKSSRCKHQMNGWPAKALSRLPTALTSRQAADVDWPASHPPDNCRCTSNTHTDTDTRQNIHTAICCTHTPV